MLSGLFFMLSLLFSFKKLLYIVEWSVISINSVTLIFTFLFDWMSIIFMFVVFFISSMVMHFSEVYMSDEVYKDRFCKVLLMFILSMVLLIVSPNLITILLGWDGLGLVSFLLVIYYQNMKSFNAGMMTILSNRIGDVALLLAISCMVNHGNWNFITMNFMQDSGIMNWVCVLVIISGITKSAQIPFSAWLPAAMAAPTPVSTLVHSSTLVTAGVYLMIRFSEFFFLIDWFQVIMLFISSVTMMMASFVACYEYDIKKIIALSTLSQLGLMMSIISLGMFHLALFHLFTHAIFKALLFICAGAVIFNFSHYQDIRVMGSITDQMPKVSVSFNSANLALCGFPFMAGFYSKDLILEVISYSQWNLVSLWMLFFSSMLTVMYSLRLSYYSFWGFYNMKSVSNLSSDGKEFDDSAMLMSVGAIIMGSMMNWMVFSYPNFLELMMSMKLMTVLVIVLGLFFFILSSSGMEINLLFLYGVKSFMSQMWFFPSLSSQTFLKHIFDISKTHIYYLDQGWLEYWGPRGVYAVFHRLSMMNQKFMINSLKVLLSVSLIMVVIWM